MKYFQCSKCKKTKSFLSIRNTDIDKKTCCSRIMRELSKSDYAKESDLNNTGFRG